jgi:WD40 repeat protein
LGPIVIYNAFMSYSHAADGKLAPRIQSALQRIAKPFFKLRALHVFRDQTSLSATPALWSSIETALNQSEYFILMASSEAAASPWVQREIDHWLTESPQARRGQAVAHFLIILTDGDILWDKVTGDFDWERTNALPELLRSTFPEEPLFVDMRGVKTEEDLSLHNPTFRDMIADLAATLHHQSKEEIIGEDIRILRRNRLLGWSGSILLASLAAVASVTAYVAVVQKKTAQSRELAARATASLESDPEQSLRYAIEGAEISSTSEAMAALRESLIQSSVRAVLKSEVGKISSAEFSPDGMRVVAEVQSTDGGRSLQLWDTSTGKPVCVIAGARSGRFTEDGRKIYTGDGRIYDALTGKEMGKTSGAGPSKEQTVDPSERKADRERHEDGTGATFRDPSGKIEFVYESEAPFMREVNSGRVLRTLEAPRDPVGGVAFSKKGGFGWFLVTWPRKNVYSESGGGPTEIGEKVAHLWGVEYSDNDSVLAGHLRVVNTAAFGPDNEVVVTGSDDRTARVWQTVGGDPFAVLRGHTGPVSQVAISPDGARVLTVSEDGTARIWEPGTVRPVNMGVADLFSLQYGIPLPKLQGKDQPAEAPMLSADRRSILARVDHSRIAVWDARTGQQKGILKFGSEEYGEPRGWLSPDGTRVVTITGEPRVAAGGEAARVWDVATGRVIAELRGDGGPIYGAAYSPDGLHIVAVGEDGTAYLWNAKTFRIVHRLHVSDGRVLHGSFSADSAHLVTASRDSFVRIWHVQSGRRLMELFGHQGGVVHASFSPDDKLIISAGEDGTRIWDSGTGKMLGRYMGYDDMAAPFITPDCSKLVTGVYGDPNSRRVHTFGACGTIDQLVSVARTRVRGEIDPRKTPAR